MGSAHRIGPMVGMLSLAWVGTVVAANSAAPPSIHLVREGQNRSAVEVLKSMRAQCIAEKNMFIDARKRQPQTWSAMEQSLKKSRPQYNVDRALAPEPNWDKFLLTREEEYFEGDKHALYTETVDHQLVDDGACGFQDRRQRRAEIDDGVHRYVIRLDKNSATKFRSPAVSSQEAQALQREALAAHPELAETLADTMKGASGLAGKITGEESVAGQPCQWVQALPNQRSQLCYWKTMPRYPGPMRRAIVLKAKVVIGDEVNIKSATVFETRKRIDAKVFEPPRSLTIQDHSGDGR